MMPHHHWRRICCKEISAHTSYRCPAPDQGHGHGSLLFITTPHHHHHMPQAPTFLLPLGTQESLKRAMMSRSLDLGLSLGLTSQTSLSSSTTSPWNAALSSVVGDGGEARPERAEERTSSPDSTELSSARGKRGERPEPSADDRLRLERAGSGLRAGSDEEDGGDGNGRKKLRLSKDQAAVLEECFKTHSTLNPKQKLALANRLNLRPRQVEVWFQNRRARTKLKQTEVDCEYLKRWCERLAEENKRLEKEVTELRALKAAAPPALGASPAAGVAPLATLTMCPSCRRVAAASPNNPCHAKSNVPPPPAAAAGNVLPSHCQFFPAADLSSQNMWNVATPVVTRELF